MKRQRSEALFIPLETRWFNAFQDGIKNTELRQFGPRWNERTCPVGRPVVLSRGYAGARLTGTIVGFSKGVAGDATTTRYPEGSEIAMIEIQLDPGQERFRP